MRPERQWVRVAGSSLCEPDVPPWRRHGHQGARASTLEASSSGTPGNDAEPEPEPGAGREPLVWAEHPEWGDPADRDSLAHELMVQDMLDTLTAELEAEARAAARARQSARPRGEVLAGALAAAGEAMGEAGQVLTEVPRVASEDLGGALGAVGVLAGQVEAGMFAICWEACGRGLHREGGFSLADWMAARMPWADRGLLGKVATVATGCAQLQNRVIGQAVATGRVPVRRAAILIEALGKVRRVIDADQYEAYVAILLQAAAEVDLSDAQLRRVAAHLLELVLDPEEVDRAERAAHEQRSLTMTRRPGGITRFVIDAPSTSAAMIEGALTSWLAAPQQGPEGQLDPRSTTQRKFDAFATVFGRGLACPEGTPQMARATLFVTMRLADLRRDTPGHGITLEGQPLSARQVRQAACEAEIIPVVLGSAGEILDLGRATRLATRAQIKALYLRDGGCTFPGCTVPAQWTIAHHAPWWSRPGAGTDLDKLALLCERHHTHVHQHDLQATIDTTGVTWHLR